MSRYLLALLVLAACPRATETDRVPRQIRAATGDLTTVVEGTNGFTFDVYGQVIDDVDGNVFLSPFSLSAALSMTMAGASGTTLAEMQSVLNDWVADQTNDRIQDLLPPGSVSASTRLVLANAIWFLADWATPFDPEDTRDGDLTRLDGSTVTAPIMALNTKELEEHGLSMGLIDGATVVRVPYADDEVSMILVVPDAVDGLPELEAGLTDAVFDGWLGALGEPGADLDLRMPSFTIELAVDAIPLLTELGMPSLFAAADLSAMTDPPGNDLSVSGVFHKAFVKVDEKGTEAAAASAVVVDESAPMWVDATHPFLFVLHDDLTGTVLFVGRLMDPTA